MTEKKNNHTMSQMTHEHHMDHDHNMSMMADSEIDMSRCGHGYGRHGHE
ncbi:hypothetical protein [Leuconostoc suionicum]